MLIHISIKNKVLISYIFLFYTFLISQEINTNLWITSVEKTAPNVFSITLNNTIVIKEVKLKKTKIGQREIINLEFPTYVSKHGKVYPQINILDKTLQERIVKVITSFMPEKPISEVKQPEFKINKFSVYNKSKSNLKVFASVLFENSIEIECKIMKGKYGVWVAWPARKDVSTNKWVQQVGFISEEYKKKLEQSLLSKYNVSRIESAEE